MADALASASARRQTITLGGNFSKQLMAGAPALSDVTISLCRLNRLVQYEPKDLTVSVQAGMSWCALNRLLADQNQMIPLDPPFHREATVGGVLAANLSGPRRRFYGTGRDMVIGMTFVTLEGKDVQTGGMVVKNVAGLDMAKLMIGSFGTLAAIGTVNFKVHPKPPTTRTFVWRRAELGEILARRNVILTSVLQPLAVDIWKTCSGYELLVQAGGSERVLQRYTNELSDGEILPDFEEESLWDAICELPKTFMEVHPKGAVTRISCRLSEVGGWLERLPAPAIARAGSGIVYGFFSDAEEAPGKGVIEFAPKGFRQQLELWPDPGDDFGMQQKVKRMFDPHWLLNRGRLYGRL